MEIWDLTELIAREWAGTAQQQGIVVQSREGSWRYSFACQVNALRVLSVLVVGKRGGLTEHLYVLDPTQRLLTDQLLLGTTNKGKLGFEGILPVRQMRDCLRTLSIQEKKEVYIREVLLRVQAELLTRAEFFEQYLRRKENPSCSVVALSGGLPSLGKRK